MFPRENSEIALTQFAGGVRVCTRAPWGSPLPRDDVVEREIFSSASGIDN